MKLLYNLYIVGALLILLGAQSATAQEKYFDRWYFGSRAGINFTDGVVSPFDGPLQTYEGSASICDPITGDLLFFTNGSTVWNAAHQVMSGGLNLDGNLSATQSALIVPDPGDESRYYIFTQDGTTFGGPRDPSGLGLRYSIVDMRGDGGLGVLVKKNEPLFSDAGEKTVAIRHPNGCDFWIVTHARTSNAFHAYLLTAGGIHEEPVVSRTGASYTGLDAGYLKASPDGTRLFAARSFIRYNGAMGELFGFDQRTGVVGQRLAVLPAGYGASFSPNNRFLYTSRLDSLHQYDLSVAPSTIASTRTLINDPNPSRMLFGMQIGPDGRIYVVDGPYFEEFLTVQMQVNVIEYPNTPGSGAGYTELYNYPIVMFFAGLPNCIDGFLGDNDVSAPQPPQYSVSSDDSLICVGGSATLTVSDAERVRWLDVPEIDCETCMSVLVSPRLTKTYSVEVYDSRYCPSIDTLRVTVQVGEREVDAGRDTTLCLGSSVQLRATPGGSSYLWSPAEGLSCIDCPNPVATPTVSTEYVVYVEDEEGCVAVGKVSVDVRQVPDVTIIPSATEIGCGESVRLNAPGGTTYSWRADPTLSCLDCADPVATPTEASTTYYLDVIDSLGCSGTDSVTITVRSEHVDAGSDTTICRGEQVQLRATGRADFLWSAEGGSPPPDCFDCPAPTVAPERTTTYFVEGSTNGQCTEVDSITVYVIDPPVPNAGPDTTICLGESVRLRASGGSSYQWGANTDLDCFGCPEPLATPGATATYRVQVTGPGGCIGWDSVTVTVLRPSDFRVTGENELCIGEETELSATGADDVYWKEDPTLTCSDCPNPVARPTVTTTYYAYGTTASGTCMMTDSITVRVRPLPEIGILGDTVVCEGESTQLLVLGGESYRWEPSPDLSCLDCASPTISPKKSGTYVVTGTNEFGCSSSDSIYVRVAPPPVVEIGFDRSVCLGDSIELDAAGGTGWLWEPASGLSCTDCRNPMAAPVATTRYTVTVWNDDGCTTTGSVLVTVPDAPKRVRMRIGRNYRALPGTSVSIPVMVLDDMRATDLRELDLELHVDRGVMAIDAGSIERLLRGTLLDGWDVDIVSQVPGSLHAVLRAPDGEVLSGTGELFRFEGRMYLGGETGTEIDLKINTAGNCYLFDVESGRAVVDSICGLNMRLIELTGSEYARPAIYPNPASERVNFEFSLGLDGETRLEVFDGTGTTVGLLIEDHLNAGTYSVQWDVTDIPSGIYWYRLTSGDWSENGALNVSR